MAEKGLKILAYKQIKKRILDCTYLPGSMINEEQIKETCGVSRTPIREALGILENEGLVSIKPKKGILVSPISIDDVNQIFEARILIEPYLLQTYGSTLNQDKLLDFFSRQSNCDPHNKSLSFELDSEFHSLILNDLTNNYLKQFFESIMEKNYRLMILTGKKDKRIHESIEEHLSITKALLMADWETAANAMLLHLQASKRSTFELLFDNNSI
ncbi:GntR family transcriptional regulator [uncultured Sphaerochaeta sp.]|uniref:GntR family transcriptional regulator n=1 Tax=uncultured Sphaerochaeta sp. TaxID=886478 RepID=UPI002A0A3113|nr:GntR family transcriptional regulator [uncultured Sphaerochaeta sp.]